MLFVLLDLCKGQENLNSATFFRNATSQLDQLQLQGFGTKEEVNFPWIEQYEFRTETRDFDIGDQEYTIRVSPSTPKKRQAQKALYEHYANAPQFENQEFRCDVFLDIHTDWTSLYLIEENILLLEKLVVIYEDKELVFQKMIEATDIPVDKIIGHEADKTKLKYSLNELSLQRDQILSKYGYENVQLDFQDFIQIDEIALKLNESDLQLNHANLNELAYERDEIQKEMDLEMARKKQYFDFAQLRYEGPHTDLLNERLSLSIGFQIPNSGSRKLRVQELQIRQESLELERRRTEEEIENRIEVAASMVAINISRFERYNELRVAEREQLNKWSQRLRKRGDISPISLLEIEERYVETLLNELDLLENVLDDYLVYLNRSGQICKEMNHLAM